MRILVTGGAGFIGSHLVEALLNEGHFVRVLDNLSTGKRDNLPAFEPQLEFIEASVEDKAAVEASCDGVDAVIHLAALVSVPASVEAPSRSMSINLVGFHNVLEALREQHFTGRLLFASSAAVYGGSAESRALQEIDAPGELASPYALDKYNNEMYAGLYERLYGINSLGFRFFNVYGPRQDPASPYSGVISIFMSRVSQGLGLVVYGDGAQTRDFVYVGDVVKTLLMALASDQVGILNLGTGVRTSVAKLAETIQKVYRSQVAVEYLPPRVGDVKDSLADLHRLEAAFGDFEKTSIESGLVALKQWLDQAC